jgi:hypothetical protein
LTRAPNLMENPAESRLQSRKSTFPHLPCYIVECRAGTNLSVSHDSEQERCTQGPGHLNSWTLEHLDLIEVMTLDLELGLSGNGSILCAGGHRGQTVTTSFQEVPVLPWWSLQHFHKWWHVISESGHRGTRHLALRR